MVERGTRSKLAGVIVSMKELGLDAVTDERRPLLLPRRAGRHLHDPRGGRSTSIASSARSRWPGTRAVEVRLWMRPRGGIRYETVVEGEREVLEVTRRTLQRPQLTSMPGHVRRSDPRDPDPARAGAHPVRARLPGDPRLQPRRHRDLHRRPPGARCCSTSSAGRRSSTPSSSTASTSIPGGFPARFGRTHGGVVAVETRATTQRRHPRLGRRRPARRRRLRARAARQARLVRGRRPPLVRRSRCSATSCPSPIRARRLIVVPVY